ncbi:Anaerobic sulfite reductase subunit B [Caloramator mitchellensis]|uniref:Anaerobic sulfite reductase subunit B n=1 Tax=Caloramator mitchellensis TaxID=908809 RepID=A0A0R3K1K1_CALMK|nr:anaerobic sulfite reductase subunit AsrB [Caloramator mitchellensis]KRQ86754.1 Anaerobic sulfite reductase subunit B [Caloramator mitchellensis]
MNPYMPFKSKILKIMPHTDIDYTFRMEYKGDVKPGQFFEVSLPKYGEAPISVSEIGPDYIDFTIRRVGRVTNTIHEFKEGQYLFIRGPYGNGFDVSWFENSEIIVAAGGTGLAPVKGIVDYYSLNPKKAKTFTLMAGFKTPDDVLFRDDFKKWEKSIDVILTVDRAEEGYKGNVGLITKYVPQLNIEDIDNVKVVVVGPPLMMKFTVQEFIKRGVKEENIWVSYERKMCCGVGKCGHCKINDTYICLEGPVFNYVKAKTLID